MSKEKGYIKLAEISYTIYMPYTFWFRLRRILGMWIMDVSLWVLGATVDLKRLKETRLLSQKSLDDILKEIPDHDPSLEG